MTERAPAEGLVVILAGGGRLACDPPRGVGACRTAKARHRLFAASLIAPCVDVPMR